MVAGFMSECVVDAFELIEVQVEKGCRALRTFAVVDRLSQSVLEQAAVGEVRKRVVERHPLHASLT